MTQYPHSFHSDLVAVPTLQVRDVYNEIIAIDYESGIILLKLASIGQ